MLYINDVQYHIPCTKKSVSELQHETNLSPQMLKIFEKFYGLREISYCNEASVFDLVKPSLDKIISNSEFDSHNIKYLIHPRTSPVVTPFGISIIQRIKEHLGLGDCYSFGTTMHKCVGFLKSLEILSVLFKGSSKLSALIVTGEIAFTPELRLIPRSSIAGDASAVAWVSNYGIDHALLGVETFYLKGYSKGFYLSDDESQLFDAQFIDTMKTTIVNSLKKANITIADISLILPHNVNLPTWKKVADSLGIAIDKVFLDQVPRLGHCFNSDGFINLALAVENKKIKKGDYYLMAACGMGFFFGCAVFQF